MKKLTKPLLCLMIAFPLLIGATSRRDPTQPPGALSAPDTITAGQPLDLTAIFVYPHIKIAIINGQVVKAGDHLGEYIITTINEDTVELTGPQNTLEVLRLLTPVSNGLIVIGH